MNDITPVISRTWDTTTECRPFGESWGTLHHTVTLTRTPAGLTAEVNGQADTLDRAVRILEGATEVTVTGETRVPCSPATSAQPLVV